MPYHTNARLEAWKRLCENNRWLAQFGQGDDELTQNGASGCTDTTLQTLILGLKKKHVTHDQIRHAAGRGPSSADRGLTAGNVAAVIEYWDLPYKLVFGLAWADLVKYQERGPIMMAIRYGDWANWSGYGGKWRPAPYARPLGHAGRNQFAGFFGAHMVLSLGRMGLYDAKGRFQRNDYWVKEPNHGSPARPERPPYDIVTGAHAKAAYNAYISKLGRTAYAVIPTHNLYL